MRLVEREGGGAYPLPPKRLPVLASSLSAALALSWLVALVLLATTLLLATRRAVAIVLVSLPLWRTLFSLLSGLSSLVPLTLSRVVLVSHWVSP
jgi:hypothetical protein